MNLLKSKTAQITVFIIIGIILLFSSALILYIKNKVTQTQPPPKIIKSVPEDLEGLNKYIEGCIYNTAKDGLILLGSQGGYIYPEDFGVFSDKLEPTESSGLEVFPDTGYVVPYWLYLKSENDCKKECQPGSMQPVLQDYSGSMAEQLSKYVEDNINFCIQDFNVFLQRGYSIKEEEPLKARTTITKEDVVVDATWKLVAGTDKPKKIERFLVRLPVNLRRIYGMAEKIKTLENENTFFEVHTLNLIAMHSDVGKDQLPPMAHYSFVGGENLRWSFSKANEKLTTILSQWLGVMRVKNTLNEQRRFYQDPVTQAVMDKTIVETFEDTKYPLTVNFKYSSFWPIYLDITPRNGDSIAGKSFSGFGVLPLLGISINQYEFQYDISYPVLVEIYDPEAFNREGYGFVFAMESNIRNNKPLSVDFAAIDVTGTAKSFFCDEQQKRSGNITVSTYDGFSGEALEGVGVVFSASKEGCNMGTTTINQDGTAALTERYPQGIGRISVSKRPDYLSQSMIYAVGEGKEDEIDFSLYPIVEKDVTVKKYVMSKSNYSSGDWWSKSVCVPWKFKENTTDIRGDEIINVFLNKVVTKESPDTLFDSIYINGSQPQQNKVRLGPGKYEVTVQTTLYKNITIPKDKRKFGKWPFRKSVTIDPVYIYPYQEGTLELDNETFYFEVFPEHLYTNKTLEIYALAYDIDSAPEKCRKHETDASPSSDAIDEIARTKRGFLAPKFV